MALTTSNLQTPDVVIIGAGGHGRVVLDILRVGGRFKPIGFLDANTSLTGTEIGGLKVLGTGNLLPKLKSQKVRGAIVAIGDNRTRVRYADLVRESGLELINAIHPAATVSSTAKVGQNVVVCAGAVIGTDASIADSCIVNTNAVVDHECELAAGVHICPGALLAGRVRIGTCAFIGLGAKVIPCLRVGDHTVIGAGAVVIRDIPEQVTAVGVPARVTNRKASPIVSLTNT